MSYQYYCISCGEKLEGNDICFDIAEFIGINNSDYENLIKRKWTLIDAEELKNIAKNCGVELQHKDRVKLEISLHDFFCIIADNLDSSSSKIADRLRKCDYIYSQWYYIFDDLLRNNENSDYEYAIICFLHQLLKTFQKKSSIDDTSFSADNYVASFYIEAEYIDEESPQDIYTVSYNTVNSPKLMRLNHPKMIRGYCPNCGDYILKGAGKYEHILIGCFGAERSGKSRLLLSMINESQHEGFPIRNPELLCDSQYHKIIEHLNLFDMQYSLKKDDFILRPSFLLVSDITHQTKIVTFLEIPNKYLEDEDIEISAHIKLIFKCQLYLMCNDINSVKKEDGGDAPAKDLVRILYNRLEKRGPKPPLCVLLTKHDIIDYYPKSTTTEESESTSSDTNFVKDADVEIIQETYENTKNEYIIQSYKKCCDAFAQGSSHTYCQWMRCASIGTTSLIRSETDNNPAKQKLWESKGESINCLWKWILQLIGMIEIISKTNVTVLPAIPDYKETYTYKPKLIFSKKQIQKSSELEARLEAVQYLFSNPSTSDKKMIETINKMNKS